MSMEQNFVVYNKQNMLCSDQVEEKVHGWNVDQCATKALDDPRTYSFYFELRSFNVHQFSVAVEKKSPTYYIQGKRVPLGALLNSGDPDKIRIANKLKRNGKVGVVLFVNGKMLELEKEDHVLTTLEGVFG